MGHRIGVDVGGTFTDVALLDDDRGRLHLGKVPTTPADPSLGALGGIEEVLALAGAAPGDVTAVGHGTTVATNALLQRRTARVGLLTTEGFRDLLAIGRQRRPELFDLTVDRALPLVPRRLRRELPERLLAGGRVARPLDLGPLEAIVEEFRREGVEALAVCFLHAYVNPAHERAVRDALARLWPGLPVSLSSDVVAEFREFERLSTTVLNAALVPLMRAYLEHFERRVRALGVKGATYLSQSSGGVMRPEAGGRLPVATLFSGPAAGVTGAIAVARQAGCADLLTFDMGGTSTDVCLVRGGEAAVGAERAVEGYPVRMAALDEKSAREFETAPAGIPGLTPPVGVTPRAAGLGTERGRGDRGARKGVDSRPFPRLAPREVGGGSEGGEAARRHTRTACIGIWPDAVGTVFIGASAHPSAPRA